MGTPMTFSSLPFLEEALSKFQIGRYFFESFHERDIDMDLK